MKIEDDTKELRMFYKTIQVITAEWEDLHEELSQKEVEYYMLKEAYNTQSEDIIASTDFKELYGKNNETVRKNHVKKELADIVKQLKDYEFSINYITRRISFLKAMTYVKLNTVEIWVPTIKTLLN